MTSAERNCGSAARVAVRPIHGPLEDGLLGGPFPFQVPGSRKLSLCRWLRKAPDGCGAFHQQGDAAPPPKLYGWAPIRPAGRWGLTMW